MELEFASPTGEPVRCLARHGRDRALPGSLLLVRRIALDDGRHLLQYRLPHQARRDGPARDALEREASAALAIEQAYGDKPYAGLFARPAGHGLDAREPFVLYHRGRGVPIGRKQGELYPEQLRQVIRELALAVRLLEGVGLVHRSLAPDTVHWDGTHVRIPAPHHAVRTGTAREAHGAAPWSSPEQFAGTGAAEPRDDLWAIAQLIYYLVAGRPAEGRGIPANLGAHRRLAVLRDAGLFATEARNRIAPAALLARLNCADPLASSPPAADPLDRGRAEFDERLAEKRMDLGLPDLRTARNGAGYEPAGYGAGLGAWLGGGRAGEAP